MSRKRKKRNKAAVPAPIPEICRWFGEPIAPGEESGNLYRRGHQAVGDAQRTLRVLQTIAQKAGKSPSPDEMPFHQRYYGE